MQQLYAKIKRSSKYHHQNEHAKSSGHGLPFKVHVLPHPSDYCVQGGPGGQYRLSDVNLFIKDENGKEMRIS